MVIVDTAQGARVASVWANDAGGTNGPDPWPVVDDRLKEARVSPRQVQVVWIKHAQNQPHTLSAFPRMSHAQYLANNTILHTPAAPPAVPEPAGRLSLSRIYAGYATTPLNPEPFAYEGAFAARWVIQSQAAGDPLLKLRPSQGRRTGAGGVWGPYLWTDGVRAARATTWSGSRRTSARRMVRIQRLRPREGRQPPARFRPKNPLASSWYLATGRPSAN